MHLTDVRARQAVIDHEIQGQDGKDFEMHVALEEANMLYACRQPKSLVKPHVHCLEQEADVPSPMKLIDSKYSGSPS